jgi:hypothetical protein
MGAQSVPWQVNFSDEILAYSDICPELGGAVSRAGGGMGPGGDNNPIYSSKAYLT